MYNFLKDKIRYALVLYLHAIISESFSEVLISCPGSLYFVVNKDVRRSDREYFFYESAGSVDDCVRKCFASEFCFSARYSHGVDGSSGCLFSYKAQLGCTSRSFITTYPDNANEITIECIRCPALGDSITPYPPLPLGDLSNHSATTRQPTITSAYISSTLASTESDLEPEPSTVRPACAHDLTFQVREPKLSEKWRLQFDSTEGPYLANECVQFCFKYHASCTQVGFVPLEGSAEGMCLFINGSTSDCSPSSKSHTDYDSQTPVLLHCIQCGAVASALIELPPIIKETESVAFTRTVSTRKTTVLTTTVSLEATASSDESSAESVSKTTKPMDATTTMQADASSAEKKRTCESGRVAFDVSHNATSFANFTSHQDIDDGGPQDCALICYERGSDCRTAGFIPSNPDPAGISVGGTCFFSTVSAMHDCTPSDSSLTATFDFTFKQPIALGCLVCLKESSASSEA